MTDPQGGRPAATGPERPDDDGDELDAWPPVRGLLLQDAYEAARELLDGLLRRGDHGDVVIASCTEFPSAWVFGYNTREFLKGGDFLRSLVGNGPVVVPKSGAEPYLGGSGTPIGAQLGEEPCDPRSS